MGDGSHRLKVKFDTLLTGKDLPLLAEECCLAGFRGAPESADWIDSGEAAKLLAVSPEVNISSDIAANTIAKINEGFSFIRPVLEKIATDRAQELLEDHRWVRTAVRLKGVRYKVEPHLPLDVIGIYVYLPFV